MNNRFGLVLGLAIGVLIAGCGERITPAENSTADTARQKPPNVLFIVADDLGYTDLGVYGSEIGTPNLDALATNGIMFKNFYAAPTCSPTRAMLLSGVDNHPAGMGSMYQEIAPNQVGQRGYEEELHSRVATIAEVLGDAGYHTYMTGKWHLGYEDDNSPAARGFDRSFASLAGGASQFDMMPMVGPGKAPYREDRDMLDSLPDDFYSTKTFTHKLIEYIDSNQADDQPFFGYLAYTAVHWPLQAPQESIARFKGQYDDGYDVLHANRVQRLKALGLIGANVEAYPRLDQEPEWDSLSEEEKQYSARLMEIYAAMVSDLDLYVGELINYLESIDELDNTFIVFLSDNGAEGHEMDRSIGAIGRWIEECCDNSYTNMGNADSYLWYGASWARASTGPWRMFKGFPSEGGIRVPAIIHYPTVHQSNVNTAVVSVMDVMPTVLDLAGIEHPTSPYKGRNIETMTGKSMLPMLRGDATTVHANDDFIGWELFGKTAIRQGDWKIIQEPAGDFWEPRDPLAENYPWQLFNLADDPSELRDLAATHPEKLAEMILLWDRYAEENQVIIPNQVMGF